mgnify:CR=1 FL=1
MPVRPPTTKGSATVARAGRMRMLLGLHVLLGIYALSDVCSKYAAGAGFPDVAFFLFYGLMLVFLGIYALGWQQIIKRMPLSSAFANRAVTIVWGIFWGALLFGEDVTPGKLVGAAIIMAGIVLYARADAPEDGNGNLNRDGARPTPDEQRCEADGPRTKPGDAA